MTLSPEDRVALLLGRAIMRADALQVLLEQAQERISELEADSECEPEAS